MKFVKRVNSQSKFHSGNQRCTIDSSIEEGTEVTIVYLLLVLEVAFISL